MQKTGKAGKARTKDMSVTERMYREGAHGLEGSSCGWSLPPLQLRTPASCRLTPGYAVMRKRGMPASAGVRIRVVPRRIRPFGGRMRFLACFRARLRRNSEAGAHSARRVAAAY